MPIAYRKTSLRTSFCLSIVGVMSLAVSAPSETSRIAARGCWRDSNSGSDASIASYSAVPPDGRIASSLPRMPGALGGPLRRTARLVIEADQRRFVLDGEQLVEEVRERGARVDHALRRACCR